MAMDGVFGAQHIELGKIINMFIETQNTIANTKKCLSCRRNLNYEFFGESRSSKDGFNSNCRLCRNQSRRLSYNKSTELFILNLNTSNQSRSPDLITLKNKFTSKAINTENWTEIYVWIEITKYSVKLSLIDIDNKPIFLLAFLTAVNDKALNAIRKYILGELLLRSLRLYDSSDEIHMLKVNDLLG